MLTAKIVNNFLGVDDSYKAPEALFKMMLDDEKRPRLFDKFLEIDCDLSRDWFVDYFQEEHAERKRFNQDFTPLSVTEILSRIVGDGKNYFESAAGSGGLMITAWDMSQKETSVFKYDPREYWYQVEELSDRAVPFLIFNMAIRGMNGVVLHGDSLERDFKNVYFIRNDTPDFLRYSEVIVMPRTEMLMEELNILSWREDLEEVTE